MKPIVVLAERNLLIEEPGAGKSLALNLIVAHAALSLDCTLVLVDGKRVELGVWRPLRGPLRRPVHQSGHRGPAGPADRDGPRRQLAASSVDARSTVLARVADPGYRRWADRAASAGGCTHPVRLNAETARADQQTGELVLMPRPSGDDVVIYKACGNRRAAVCPSCAETYRADAYQLVLAGLRGGKGVPDTVVGNPAVFATLTGPSFGAVMAATSTLPGEPCGPVTRTGVGPSALTVGCCPAGGGTASTTLASGSRCAGLLRLSRVTRSGTPGPASYGGVPPSRSTGPSSDTGPPARRPPGCPSVRSPSSNAAASCTTTSSCAWMA